MEQSIEKALSEGEFSPDDVALLSTAEKKDGPLLNWTEVQFKDVLGAIPGTAAFAIVRRLRTPEVAPANRTVTLPEKPPYLYDADGRQVAEYDPTDPTQFWTAPTGELYRWDGKRDRTAGKPVKNLMGHIITKTKFPYGEPRLVMKVHHATIDGIPVPDAKQVSEARLKGYDWFHMGLGQWIGGAKPYRPADQSLLRRLKDATARTAGGNPAIVRG